MGQRFPSDREFVEEQKPLRGMRSVPSDSGISARSDRDSLEPTPAKPKVATPKSQRSFEPPSRTALSPQSEKSNEMLTPRTRANNANANNSNTTPSRAVIMKGEDGNFLVTVDDDYEIFVGFARFLYTGFVEVTDANCGLLLAISDRYQSLNLLHFILDWVKNNFSSALFYDFFTFTVENKQYRQQLKNVLLKALDSRAHFESITRDSRWADLPVDFVAEQLGDGLAFVNEHEVLGLAVRWCAGDQDKTQQDISRVLGNFRHSELNLEIHKILPLMKLFGLDQVCSSKPPRQSKFVEKLEYPFILTSNMTLTSEIGQAPVSALQEIPYDGGSLNMTHRDELNLKDGFFNLHLKPRRLRITIECSIWAHRERRTVPGTGSTLGSFRERAHPRDFPDVSAVRSASMSQERTRSLDLAGREDSSEILPKGRRTLGRSSAPLTTQQQMLIEHYVLCGISAGSSRYGVSVTQKERTPIYLFDKI